MSAIPDPRLQILEGKAASDWLEQSANRAAWQRLYADCPWRTPILSPTFVECWLRHYHNRWSLLLITESTAAGELVALLPLARNHHLITGAGAHQAEYQGWLATGSTRDFPVRALQALRARWPAHRLRLRYLPPGIPVEGFEKALRALRLSAHRRPLMALERERIQAALRKKGNRSRLNRLRRLGEPELRQLRDASELKAVLPRIAAFYDLRQGGQHGDWPFTDDPAKAPFLLTLAEATPSPLHISLLTLDGEPVSAILGIVDDDVFSLAITAQSPRHAALSPGKMHLYLLAERLLEEGLSRLDLTPGDDPWKERFADRHETVWELEYLPGVTGWLDVRLRRPLEETARQALTIVGLPPARIRAWLRAENPTPSPRLYRLRRPPADFATDNISVRTGEEADLLTYRPPSDQALSRQAFARDAWRRLARGEIPWVAIEDGRLRTCVWLVRQPPFFAPGSDKPLSSEEIGTLLALTAWTPDAPHYTCALIRRILGDLGKDREVGSIYMVTIDDSALTALPAIEPVGALLPGGRSAP